MYLHTPTCPWKQQDQDRHQIENGNKTLNVKNKDILNTFEDSKTEIACQVENGINTIDTKNKDARTASEDSKAEIACQIKEDNKTFDAEKTTCLAADFHQARVGC